MKSSVLPVVVSVLAATLACSSSSFEVVEPGPDATTTDGSVDTATQEVAVDSSVPADTSSPADAPADSSLPVDSGTVDSGKPDTAPIDAGCASGSTIPCECGGVRKCSDGGFGECVGKCPVAPARYLCFFGKNGCTIDSCLDSNNCSAKCSCPSSGSKCVTSDPCWSQACDGYVCP